MARHWLAHHAEADEADLFHDATPARQEGRKAGEILPSALRRVPFFDGV
jgi:hypothetical protein